MSVYFQCRCGQSLIGVWSCETIDGTAQSRYFQVLPRSGTGTERVSGNTDFFKPTRRAMNCSASRTYQHRRCRTPNGTATQFVEPFTHPQTRPPRQGGPTSNSLVGRRCSWSHPTEDQNQKSVLYLSLSLRTGVGQGLVDSWVQVAIRFFWSSAMTFAIWL